MNINEQLALAKSLGMPIANRKLPNDLHLGQMQWNFSIPDAVAQPADIGDFRLGANLVDPNLRDLGWSPSTDRPQSALAAYAAQIEFYGAGSLALTPSDVARVSSALYLRHNDSGKSRWHPLRHGFMSQGTGVSLDGSGAPLEAYVHGMGYARELFTWGVFVSDLSKEELTLYAEPYAPIGNDISARVRLWGMYSKNTGASTGLCDTGTNADAQNLANRLIVGKALY